MCKHRRKAENALIESESPEEELDDKEAVETEILQCMKLLVRKIHALEKIIAQEKQNT